MLRRSKYDIAAIHAAMVVECPECHHKITPSEAVRFDSERYECPKCRAKFVPVEKSGPKVRIS